MSYGPGGKGGGGSGGGAGGGGGAPKGGAGYARAGAYRQTSVMTASRGQILIMLYEGAIANVKKATIALDRKDMAMKGAAIVKAHDIVNELLNSLDFNVGGQIARDLERLYHFIAEKLIQANLKNSKEDLVSVQKLLETLLSGWKGAVEQVQKTQGQGQGQGAGT